MELGYIVLLESTEIIDEEELKDLLNKEASKIYAQVYGDKIKTQELEQGEYQNGEKSV